VNIARWARIYGGNAYRDGDPKGYTIITHLMLKVISC